MILSHKGKIVFWKALIWIGLLTSNKPAFSNWLPSSLTWVIKEISWELIYLIKSMLKIIFYKLDTQL